jgi:hypothetical protein
VDDELVIATTDFSPLLTEIKTIQSISGNTVYLNGDLEYEHFSGVTHGVNESCEVGLLTRNIVFNGGNGGGHLRVRGT